ncbi:MAG TPA: retroviral-like aspartic protease family protein [Sphingomonadaceae bacterium]|nr:retroviral-like aspartic protease family protein [Sphingomonadaceae bacterium]
MGWKAAASAALVAAMTTTLSAQDATTSAARDAAGNSVQPPGDLDVFRTGAEEYDRLTVPVTVEGQGPYQFMIDTGAQATVLSRELADRLGVADRKTATLVGISSRAQTQVAPVMELGLGKRLFYIETVPLVEQANIGSADGILGLDSLQEQRVLLDFRAKTFSVADAETLGGDKGYDIVVRARRVLGQLVITDAELDGVRVAVIVGTGAQGSVGNLKLQEKLRGRDLGEAQMTDINGAMETSSMRLAKSVTIGRVKVSNLPIAFVDSPSFKVLGLDDRPAMVLGMSELKLFKRVAIDFKQRKVLFDLPRGAGWFDAPTGGMGSD